MFKRGSLPGLFCAFFFASAALCNADGQVFVGSFAESNGIGQAVEKALGRLKRILQRYTEGREPSVPPVIVASDPENLWTLFQAHSSALSEAELYDAFGSKCNQREAIFTGDVIVLCVFIGNDFDPQAARTLISIALAHELYHSVQFNLVGIKSLDEIDDTLKAFGPAWLMEGSALYFGEFYGCDTCALNMEMVASGLRHFTSNMTTPLSDLEYFPDDPVLVSAQYYKGFLATMTLVLDHGDMAILDFYRTIGDGEDWKNAFYSTFGTSVENFYKNFE